MIQLDSLYIILIVYGLIVFGIGFALSKNLAKEKIDDLQEVIKELKSELKKCQMH